VLTKKTGLSSFELGVDSSDDGEGSDDGGGAYDKKDFKERMKKAQSEAS
jgi:hypothetical protein